MTRSSEHYLVADGRLFDFSVRPLYFGEEATVPSWVTW